MSDDDESNTIIINNETVSNKHGKLQQELH